MTGDRAPQPSPEHIDAMADALRSAGVEVGSVGGQTFREHAARRILTDPTVHAAMLDTLVRAAVLTEERANIWTDPDDGTKVVWDRTPPLGSTRPHRRLATVWEQA